MDEVGVDLAMHASKSVQTNELEETDLVVMVCAEEVRRVPVPCDALALAASER